MRQGLKPGQILLSFWPKTLEGRLEKVVIMKVQCSMHKESRATADLFGSGATVRTRNGSDGMGQGARTFPD